MKTLLVLMLAILSACSSTTARNEDAIAPDSADGDAMFQPISQPKPGPKSAGGLVLVGSANVDLYTQKGTVAGTQSVFDTPQVYTVMFSVIPPVEAASKGIFEAIATISWKVAGNDIVRTIDVGNGASISAPCEGVQVSVKDVTPKIGALPAGYKYSVGISISAGERASYSQLPTLKALPWSGTAEGNILAAGASITIDIPPGAIGVEVNAIGTNALNAGPVNVVVVQTCDVNIFKQYKLLADGTDTRMVPIVGGANKLTVNNLSATVGIAYTITWGIDG